MLKNFKLAQWTQEAKEKSNIEFLDNLNAQKVYEFHKSFDQYEKTPLVNLKDLSKDLGLEDIFVKDESYRFDLNAFKVLGGSYSIGNYIAKKLGKDLKDLSYKELISDEVKEELGDLTFITATDGNHGRGVAWTANKLRQKSIVYMPKGSAQERADNISAEGAEVTITDLNYDEAVRLANQHAEENGWIMVQDTSWDGYEDIPRWIMQGYMTMAYEAYEDLNKKNIKPTHIFIQAGVGSLATAVTGFFCNMYQDEKPIITIVEPNKADCFYQSVKAGERKIVDGDMDTIMAGLACGEPSTIGWEIIKEYVENYLSIPDYVAAYGMRVLGNPLGKDKKIISGESGAAPLGAVSKIMTEEKLEDIKVKLQLDKNSVVLLFNTEGDTDRKNYRDIVWDGKCQSMVTEEV